MHKKALICTVILLALGCGGKSTTQTADGADAAVTDMAGDSAAPADMLNSTDAADLTMVTDAPDIAGADQLPVDQDHPADTATGDLSDTTQDVFQLKLDPLTLLSTPPRRVRAAISPGAPKNGLPPKLFVSADLPNAILGVVWPVDHSAPAVQFNVARVEDGNNESFGPSSLTEEIGDAIGYYYHYRCLGGLCQNRANTLPSNNLSFRKFRYASTLGSSQVGISYKQLDPIYPVQLAPNPTAQLTVYRSLSVLGEPWLGVDTTNIDAELAALTTPKTMGQFKVSRVGSNVLFTAYVIMWNDSDKTINGQCRRTDTPSQKPFSGLSSGLKFPAASEFETQQQFVLLGTQDSEAVLVYGATDNTVKAIRVNADCGIVGAPQTLIDRFVIGRLKGAMWKTGNFVLVWQDSDGVVRGRGFQHNLLPLGPTIDIAPAEHPFLFDTSDVVAWGIESSSFVVVWSKGAELFARTIDN